MIEVTGLVKRHGAATVLDGVDLAVGRGRVHAVIGPSGGGKSTLLRCLNGLEPYQAGRVRVGDHLLPPDVDPRRHAALLAAVRRTVGFVFQQFHLFPHLTVMGNLVEAPVQVLRERPDAARARGLALLDRVGLAHRADARPRELSGGQQQRVAIARALMMGPEVVLFDEPTSALDPVSARDVLAVIGDLARDGQTMVVVTHAMAFARDVADVVHVLADGRVVEQGTPARVFGAPGHEVTRAFLARAG